MTTLTDPYTPAEPTYECYDCGHRVPAEGVGNCPECEGPVRNIGVPRE